jgi:hypothetical protein
LLRAGRPTTRSSSPGRDKNFLFSTSGSGVHPASYPKDTGGSPPEREADYSPPASAEGKKMWIYTSTPPYSLMALCLIKPLKTESESVLLYDWGLIAYQFVLASSTLRISTSNCFFQLSTCGFCPYVTSSLTRGWVCCLQLLLDLVSAIILSSGSRGTHDNIVA